MDAPEQSGRGRYLPIRDYAAVGDGRTVALIARNGSVDWLCLPDLDSPSVFAALLDADRGGRFELCPEESYQAHRRYRPDTNVLETTFETASGSVRITDAMTLPGRTLTPLRELARRIEGLSGRVRLHWRVEPRFGYAERSTRIERHAGVPVAISGSDAVAVCCWETGTPQLSDTAVSGSVEARAGGRSLLALVAAFKEPLVLPSRDNIEARLDSTIEFWQQWARSRHYDGPWRDAVIRSALVLKLLVYAPSGAISAAATTSLPEELGGERNWDYRFCWIRDSSFVLESLLQLGCTDEARSFFWWFRHATQRTHPRVQVFYRLDGGDRAPERELPLAGYAGSRPVRIGNAALDQLQLDTYGHLLNTASLYATHGHGIDRDTAGQLAETADLVCRIWQQPDHGIWEVRAGRQHFTHSKLMCWVALERALRLADEGYLSPARGARWREEAARIRDFIDGRCWSERLQSYVQVAGGQELDASLLMMAIERYRDPRDARIVSTIDAIRRDLGRDGLLYRYAAEDGLRGREGMFLACSFWLVEALALSGRRQEAAQTMQALLALANDVGLYAEEIEPIGRAFLGNFPQALVHLALISAAVAFAQGTGA